MRMKKFFGAVMTLTMVCLTCSTVFAATPKYQYNFDGTTGGAQTAVRVGDVDGLPPTPVLPTADASVAAQFDTGVNGQAVYLDSSYGLILDAAAVGNTYSIAFWVNPARFSNFGPIIQIGEDLLDTEGKCAWLNVTKTDWAGDIAPVIWSRSEPESLKLGTDPGLVWPWYQTAYFAADQENGVKLEKNAWNHVVITVDSTKVGMDPVLGTEVPGTVVSQLYINGEFVGEGPVANGTFINDSKVYVGINCWDSLFKGLFDDIKIYDVALTSDEVVTAMNEPAVDAAADTAASTTTSNVPKTGVVGLGLVYGLGAIATGAALLKKKEK